MLQPNCSEIVFWLREQSIINDTIINLLDTLMDKYPLLKIKSSSEPSIRYFILEKSAHTQLLNKYPDMFYFGKHLNSEEIDNLYLNILKGVNYADFIVDGEENALYYHQHHQQIGFPVIYEIQCLTNLQPQSNDGGSLTDYAGWKQNKGYALSGLEKTYLRAVE